MIPKLTSIPEEFLAELASLQAHERLALSPAFQAFLSKTATRRTQLEAAYWQTLRSSQILRVAQGASYWTSVDLLDGDQWGATIRTALFTESKACGILGLPLCVCQWEKHGLEIDDRCSINRFDRPHM